MILARIEGGDYTFPFFRISPTDNAAKNIFWKAIVLFSGCLPLLLITYPEDKFNFCLYGPSGHHGHDGLLSNMEITHLPPQKKKTTNAASFHEDWTFVVFFSSYFKTNYGLL